MLQDIGWTSLELRITTTCLNFLCKMSSGQIDIDVNSYQNFIMNLELDGIFDIGKDIGKTRWEIASIFVITIRLWYKLPAKLADWKSLAVLLLLLLLVVVLL